MPLTNTAADRRCHELAAITEALRAAAEPRTVGELAEHFEASGAGAEAARATVAWLLKYGLLRAEV